MPFSCIVVLEVISFINFFILDNLMRLQPYSSIIKILTNQQEIRIIEDLLSDDVRRRNAALQLIYKNAYSMVESFVMKNKGSKSDAKDVFQDGIMIFYRNIYNKNFKFGSSLATYMFSICKNLWLMKLRRNILKITDDIDSDQLVQEQIEIEQSNIQSVKEMLLELKEECRDMLVGFYYENRPMKDLALRFSLASEQAAKNKKMRCLKYLSSLILKKGLSYQNFRT